MSEQAANWMPQPDDTAVARRAAEVARLLPFVFQRTVTDAADDPLGALLSAMALLQLRVEERVEGLDRFFDAGQAPLRFLVFLAYWLDLEPLLAPGRPSGLAWMPRDEAALAALLRRSFPPGEARLRALVAAAVPLAQRRGTAAGLRDFLTVATGLDGFDVVEHQERPFHLDVVYPQPAEPMLAFVRRLINYQKPAYVTYDMVPATAR